MKKRWWIVIALAIFLVIFQVGRNEFIEPNPVTQPSSNELLRDPLPFRVAGEMPAQARFLYLVNARNTVTMNKTKLSEKHPYYYKIEIQKGQIEALDHLENHIADIHHCLSDPQKNKLLQILSNAQICESPEIEAPVKNIHCKMNYSLPYAILEFVGADTARFNLGEKNTACDYPTALCGENNSNLIEWVREVLTGMRSLACPSP